MCHRGESGLAQDCPGGPRGTAGSGQRGTLLAHLEAGTDPRVERYWQLTAVIAGKGPFSSQAPLKWLAAALRAQHEQGR